MQDFHDSKPLAVPKNNGFTAAYSLLRPPRSFGRMAANILVVEDDLLIRELISKVLRQEGHRIVEASDGAVAQEKLQVLQFDLVITDVVMPKLNGIMLVEQLRTLQPRLPIIFITGYFSVISDQPMLSNMTVVLPKPFELGVLRSTVQRLLRDSAPC